MANYNNLGFTDREAQLISELIYSFAEDCPNIHHGHVLTEAGAPVNRDVDFIEPWGRRILYLGAGA